MKVNPEDHEVMGPGWEEIRSLRQEERERWERRAAQWSALALARIVFGEETSARLASYPSRGGIHGLLHLEVPFDTLEDHRARESHFLELVARDPVLEQLPFLFAFDPRPELEPVEAPT